MKPDTKPQMNVIVRQGARAVVLNARSQWLEVPGNLTVAELMRRGITVRIHRSAGVLLPEDLR